MSIVFLEGEFLPEKEAKIPVSDRGFLFGDGAYATLQVRDGYPLFLETHLKRLEEQCLSFNLKFPKITPETVFELIRLNKAEKGIWRMKILITGGDRPEMSLPSRQGRVVITIKPHESSMEKVPLKMTVFGSPYVLCHASYKSLASLNRYYMMQYAKEQSFDDAVALSEKGIVLEASFGNLFWIDGKKFYTPSPELPLYFGVTLMKALKAAEKLNFEIHYVKMPLKNMPEHAFYFRTNTMGGLWPIVQIGTFHFSYSEDLDETLQEGFEELILNDLSVLK